MLDYSHIGRKTGPLRNQKVIETGRQCVRQSLLQRAMGARDATLPMLFSYLQPACQVTKTGLNLYADYLLSTFGAATSTGLPEVFESEVNHALSVNPGVHIQGLLAKRQTRHSSAGK